MKKVLLSGFVIFTFLGYSVQQRFDAEQTSVIVPNSSVTPSAGFSTIVTPTPSPTAAQAGSTPPLAKPTATPTPKQLGQYRDGQYTGSVADAYYGNIQVKAIISGGKITDVQFLQYPNDRNTSIEINTQAMPYLKQEAIQAQSANVNGVSGASASSAAFVQSLQSALNQAK